MKKKFSQSYSNWLILSEGFLEEYDGQTTFLKHKNGMEVFHIHNKNPENLFSFMFKTLPQNNTGVAHILEHVVLCGSKKYPLKDPFLNLIKSSLNTFVNAFTFPDKTMYLASSAVEKDFFNLMHVYADAVFQPLLSQAAFFQEGWHFTQNDSNGSLDISGIVYNEMKGEYSSAESLQRELSVKSLFEKSLYQYDSGGNPEDIPSLCYEKFIEFYQKHYHPSLCRLFLFGNIPLETHLNFLDKEILSQSFDKHKQIDLKNSHDNLLFSYPKLEVLPEPRWKEPKFLTFSIPATEHSHLSCMLINWLSCDITESEEILGLEILSDILLSDSSPLVRDLIDKGIGEDFSPLSGYDSDLRDTVFSLGMRGIEKEKETIFYKAIFESLKKITERSLNKDLVEGVLFKFDFNLREVKGSGQGISAMLRSARAWNHDGHPHDTLEFKKNLEKICKRCQSEKYFENLIQKYLLDNPHHTCTLFKVDENFEEQEQKKFSQWIQKKSLEWLPAKKDLLQEIEQSLKDFQETPDSPEALSQLPVLSKEDLPQKIRPSLNLLTSEINPCISKILQKTNGIIYTSLFFSLSHLDEKDFLLLSLLTTAWDSLGLKGLSHEELDRQLKLCFGYITFSISHETNLQGQPNPCLNIRWATTEDRQEKALHLIRKLLNEVDFSQRERLKELTLELKNDFQSILTRRGNSLAESYAFSLLDSSSLLKEKHIGLTAYQFFANISQEIDEKILNLSYSLEEIYKKILNQKTARALIVSDDNQILRKIEIDVDKIISELPIKPYIIQLPKLDVISTKVSAFLLSANKVNFNAEVFKGFHYQHPDYPIATFIAHLLRSSHLWQKVRMQGGAYGASANAHSLGFFSFSSFRDPHTQKTLNAFRESLKEISNTFLTNQEIHKILIGMLGSDLAPISPSDHAYISFKLKEKGISDKMRQEIRNKYFNINGDDILRVAHSLYSQQEDSVIACITSSELLEKEPFQSPVQKFNF